MSDRDDAPTAGGAHPGRRRSPGIAIAGLLGELLITMGALLGLFVVWQLWWTDVIADRAQAELVTELGWTQYPAPGDQAAVLHREPAPVMEAPAHATTFATLRVPRWGQEYLRPVSEGTSTRDVLDTLGIGHYEGTAMPGGIGNFAIAAHRTTYGKPFNRITELQLGDPLVVQTEDIWYVYRVTGTQVVRPRQVEVIAPVPGDPAAEPTAAIMTMTTCHPMYSARERFIVHAELDYWMRAEDGTPAEIS